MPAATHQQQFINRQVAAFTAHEPGVSPLLKKHRLVIDLINRSAPPGANILEMGCSDGKILKQLERDGYRHLYGIDFQRAAKTHFQATSIHFAAADFERDPFPFKVKFDVIVFADVLEHLFSPQTVLFDLLPHLKKNGKIIFSVPNAGWWLNGWLLTFFPSKLFLSTAFGPWGHTYQFTFYQVKRLASQLNLSVPTLTGGPLDNYAFKHGFKKLLFDLFALVSTPLIALSPTIFSAHIFGVMQKKGSHQPPPSRRFDVGI